MSEATKVLAQESGEDWTMYNADCVEGIRALPDDSIGYTIFSPPFRQLFTYSNSTRDMGNGITNAEFNEHIAFLAKELYPVTEPGRCLSMHTMLLPTSKARDGFTGLSDFRGDLIKLFQSVGFTYSSEVCIWKNPVTAMQRTKAVGLLWKTIQKDSAANRQGIADYLMSFHKPQDPGEELDLLPGFLVTCRKPGVNIKPIAHTKEEFPVAEWQNLASPIWMDIDQSDTLQYRAARENNDERHICLARGSLVLTRDGYRPIEELSVGDEVLTHLGRWRPITAKVCNGVRPIVRTTGHGVADLRTTPDHKLWTRAGRIGLRAKATAMKSYPTWVPASETRGSFVNLKLPPIEESQLSADEWWIVGRWLGDGHLDVRGSPFITCAFDEESELLAKLGARAGHVNRTQTAKQVYVKGNRGGKHNDLVHHMIWRCGSGADRKRVPAEALALNPELAAALFNGYLSADGHTTSTGRRSASSVSRALVLGMAMVAQRAFGVVASVYAGRPAGTTVIQGRTVNTKADWIFGLPAKRNYSGFIAEDGAWKRVRKIEDAGEAEVWDIQVADDASFTAEGCIVHNCPLQLEVIRRGLRLWSRPGDVVLDPFGGIGSTPYVAIGMGRKGMAFELKPSYFRQAVANLRSARRQGDLFAQSAAAPEANPGAESEAPMTREDIDRHNEGCCDTSCGGCERIEEYPDGTPAE